MQSVGQGVVPDLARTWGVAFSCNSSHNIALVRCPYAFRLRTRAQNGCPGLCLRDFQCKFVDGFFCDVKRPLRAAAVEILMKSCQRSLRDPVQLLMRSVVKILRGFA